MYTLRAVRCMLQDILYIYIIVCATYIACKYVAQTIKCIARSAMYVIKTMKYTSSRTTVFNEMSNYCAEVLSSLYLSMNANEVGAK